MTETQLAPAPEAPKKESLKLAPHVFGKVVDSLLASPHFGEKWARPWLDLTRFAESHGFEHDYDRTTAYPYRDFVIQAFNDDMPFTTFVHWQLEMLVTVVRYVRRHASNIGRCGAANR